MHILRSGSATRSRWAAIGAAVAVTVGSGGLMTASADIGTGDRPVFVSITPCRVADTRPGTDNVGPRSTPLGAAETYSFMVRGTNGNCTIPADALGVAVNVAAVFPTANSFFTLFPADAATRPLSANLNFVSGQPPVSNSASIRLSADGRMSIFNLAGTVHFTLDITGYYVGHHHDDRYFTKTELDARQWTSANILDGTIALADLAPNSVDGSKVVDNSLTGDDIAFNSLLTGDIATNAIDSDEVLDFSLSNQDINVFYAVVNGTTGAVVRSSGGVTASRIVSGNYAVDFGRNIENCAYLGTVGDPTDGIEGPGQIDTATRAGNVEAAFVRTTNSSGTDTDFSFHLAVVC